MFIQILSREGVYMLPYSCEEQDTNVSPLSEDFWLNLNSVIKLFQGRTEKEFYAQATKIPARSKWITFYTGNEDDSFWLIFDVRATNEYERYMKIISKHTLE